MGHVLAMFKIKVHIQQLIIDVTIHYVCSMYKIHRTVFA